MKSSFYFKIFFKTQISNVKLCLLPRLSLIEDELSESEEGNMSGEEEPEIEDYESDSESSYTLVRQTKC